MDFELLRSFVSVVDTGGFTRAGERIHRTQSTVSQQIKRLESNIGRQLLNRNGKLISLTEDGERLLSYARRILALADEAKNVVADTAPTGIVRLGVPEDFATNRLSSILSKLTQTHANHRLDVRCKLNYHLRHDLADGKFDIALIKRNAGDTSENTVAIWPEKLNWVTSKEFPIDHDRDPLPLAVFDQGCLFRRQAIDLLEETGRSWSIDCTCSSLSGIRAAVSIGAGISILSDVNVLADHQVLGKSDGFPELCNTEIALVVSNDASSEIRRFARRLIDIDL